MFFGVAFFYFLFTKMYCACKQWGHITIIISNGLEMNLQIHECNNKRAEAPGKVLNISRSLYCMQDSLCTDVFVKKTPIYWVK